MSTGMNVGKVRRRVYLAALLVLAVVPLPSAVVLYLEELSTPWQRRLAYQVDELRIVEHLEFLASSPRLVGSEHFENASRYIEEAFRSYGLVNVHYEMFEVSVPTGTYVNGSPLYRIMETRNVIGEAPGKGDEIAIISAHYDSVNTTGADDNASGVSAMLEVARVLSPLSRNLTVTIRFVGFSAEEQDAYGSRHYVEEHRGEAIAMMINLDSVGYKGSRSIRLFNSCTWAPVPPRPYAEAMMKAARELGAPLSFKGGWMWGSPSGAFAPFAEAQVSILFLTEDDYEVIHTLSDTLENVSPTLVRQVAQTVLYAVALIYTEGSRWQATLALEATTRSAHVHKPGPKDAA